MQFCVGALNPTPRCDKAEQQHNQSENCLRLICKDEGRKHKSEQMYVLGSNYTQRPYYSKTLLDLRRFQSNKIAAVADIEKTFLKISLQEPSQDVTRFLWLNDISNPC